MILIFGGAYQGKLDFVKERFGVDDSQVEALRQGTSPEWDKKVLYGLEQTVLDLTRQELNPVEFFAANRDKLENKIVIINDISQGIVPVDKTLRAWREAVGRTMLYLAEEAEQVYRVFCGIGQRIK